MNLRLRPVAPTELDLLQEMMRDYYEHDHLEYVEARARQATGALIADERLGFLRLIEQDETVIGYVAVCFGFSIECGGRDAFVDELYVRPERRNRGIGGQALELAATHCRSQGIVALRLEVTRGNARVRELYRRHGFTEHDRFLMSRYPL